MYKKTALLLLLPLLAASHVPGNAWQQESIASTAAARAASGTQEALTITVTNGTSFTATPNLWLKQSDVQTVGTIDQALAQLPKSINHAVVINAGAGTYSSATVSGFSGAGSITINGEFALATGFTGTMSGTTTAASAQGSSTSYGSIRQSPATWTTNELRGKAFVEVNNGGTLYYRVVQATDTDDAYFYTMGFEPDSMAYRIVENDSVIVTSLTVTQTSIPITVTKMKVSDLTASHNKSLNFEYVSFVSASNVSQYNDKESYTECIFETSTAAFSYGRHLYVGASFLFTSNATATYMGLITGEAFRAHATGTTSALTLTNVLHADMGFYATDCTFTPLTLTDVALYKVSGFGLVGSGNTGTAGVVMTSRVAMAYGSLPTLAATANLVANGTSASWPAVTGVGSWHNGTVSIYPSVSGGATTMVSNTAITATTVLTATTQFLTPYVALSGAGTVIGDCTAASNVSTVLITGGADGSGVCLPAPTATPAKVQDYFNNTAGTIKIYPSASGTVIINSLGDDAPYDLTTGKAIRVYPASTGQYYVIALN